MTQELYLKLVDYAITAAIIGAILGPLIFLLVKALIQDRRDIIRVLNNHFEHDIAVKKDIAVFMATSVDAMKALKDEIKELAAEIRNGKVPTTPTGN